MKHCVAAPMLTAILGVALWLAPQRDSSLLELQIGWCTLTAAWQATNQELETLDIELDAAKPRIASKKAVIDELRAGRITLLEAAQQFQALESASTRFFPGSSERERSCRQVIHWTAHQDPCLASCLEAEL